MVYFHYFQGKVVTTRECEAWAYEYIACVEQETNILLVQDHGIEDDEIMYGLYDKMIKARLTQENRRSTEHEDRVKG